MARTGTYSIADLRLVTDTTITEFGLDAVAATLQAELDAHNAVVADIIQDFATPTTQKIEAAGGALDGEMEETDDFGRVRTQKFGDTTNVGYPLRAFQYAVGWTAEFLRSATPAQLAVTTVAAESAHLRALQRGIRGGLFRPTNYSFTPYVGTDKTVIPVKALYNGDGTAPVVGPNLETFAGTHNHYLSSATLTAAVLDSLITTVAEHSTNNRVRVYINRSDAATVRALAGFVAYLPAQIIAPNNVQSANTALDTTREDNRPIGAFNGAEVWTKPWIFPSYAVAVNINAADKPLKMREPENAAQRGLRPLSEIVTFPLQAQYFGAWFGFGAHNRGAAAVLDFGSGVYRDPTA